MPAAKVRQFGLLVPRDLQIRREVTLTTKEIEADSLEE
jgi:hypothetical protein